MNEYKVYDSFLRGKFLEKKPVYVTKNVRKEFIVNNLFNKKYKNNKVYKKKFLFFMIGVFFFLDSVKIFYPLNKRMFWRFLKKVKISKFLSNKFLFRFINIEFSIYLLKNYLFFFTDGHEKLKVMYFFFNFLKSNLESVNYKKLYNYRIFMLNKLRRKKLKRFYILGKYKKLLLKKKNSKFLKKKRFFINKKNILKKKKNNRINNFIKLSLKNYEFMLNFVVLFKRYKKKVKKFMLKNFFRKKKKFKINVIKKKFISLFNIDVVPELKQKLKGRWLPWYKYNKVKKSKQEFYKRFFLRSNKFFYRLLNFKRRKLLKLNNAITNYKNSLSKDKSAIIHLKSFHSNYYITLTDMSYNVIFSCSAGSVTESNNKKRKISTVVCFPMLYRLFFFLKAYKINSLKIEIKSRFDKFFYNTMYFLLKNRFKIKSFSIVKRSAHHFGQRKNKPRRI